MRNLLFSFALSLLTIPAYAQSEVRPDTLDWRGYYPLEIGTVWEWQIQEYGGFQDLVHRQRIDSDTLVDGQRWVVQTGYVEGIYYGETVAEHDTLLLRYDDLYGRVLARSPDTGEEYDYTCDLSGDFGAEVLCGADLEEPYSIVLDGGYAKDFDDDPLTVGSDTVRFAAAKYDSSIFSSVPWVYYHGVGRRQQQPADGFDGTIAFTYLRVGGMEYGSPASFVGTEHPIDRAEDGLVLFPNPVSNTLTVRFGHVSGPAVLRVHDLIGRLALERVHCASPCQLDVGLLAAGVYLVAADFKRGGRHTRYFVVSR